MIQSNPPREPEPSHGTDEEGDVPPADAGQDGAWVKEDDAGA